MFLQELVPCRSRASQGCVPISPQGCDTKMRGYDRSPLRSIAQFARRPSRSPFLVKLSIIIRSHKTAFLQSRSTERKLYPVYDRTKLLARPVESLKGNCTGTPERVRVR
ncbi:hypothetical protein [Microcoleus sp.]|uniref:hypothetical protein n=1 Tax=Microcoleus sp. TaxID=44472 RepID=UPI00403E83C0